MGKNTRSFLENKWGGYFLEEVIRLNNEKDNQNGTENRIKSIEFSKVIAQNRENQNQNKNKNINVEFAEEIAKNNRNQNCNRNENNQ